MGSSNGNSHQQLCQMSQMDMIMNETEEIFVEPLFWLRQYGREFIRIIRFYTHVDYFSYGTTSLIPAHP